MLAARNDPREVIADPQARYFGIAPSERTLLPGDDARLGATRFEDWFTHTTGQILRYNSRSVTEASHA